MDLKCRAGVQSDQSSATTVFPCVSRPQRCQSPSWAGASLPRAQRAFSVFSLDVYYCHYHLMQKTRFPLVQVLSHCALCVLDNSERSVRRKKFQLQRCFPCEPGVLCNFRAHPSRRIQRTMPSGIALHSATHRQASSPFAPFPPSRALGSLYV